jgi:hypothetical protein
MDGVFATGWWSAVVGAGKKGVKRRSSSENATVQQSEIPLRGLGDLPQRRCTNLKLARNRSFTDRPKTSGEKILK